MRSLVFISIFVLGGIQFVKSQDILLEKDLDQSVYTKKVGPDKDKFSHLYYDFSFYIPRQGAVYDGIKSFRTYVGYRKYYRLATRWMMGGDLEFGWENFNILQNNQKVFPETGTHRKEVINTSNLGLAYFNRYQITRHEGSLGTWLDVGIYTNLNISSRHVIKDKAASTDEMRYHKEVFKGLKYLNPYEFGLKGLLGYKRYALKATYRMSNWLSNDNSPYEPPRFSLGMEIGLY